MKKTINFDSKSEFFCFRELLLNLSVVSVAELFRCYTCAPAYLTDTFLTCFFLFFSFFKLLEATGVEFAARDVLQDPALREGVKKFTGWPTIPQVFIGGEFVGGSDTLFEEFKSGELDKRFNTLNIKRLPEEGKKD